MAAPQPFPHTLRRRINTLVSLALAGAMLVAFGTGLVAAALAAGQFPVHKYTSYALLGLAIVHTVLHWRSLVAQVRRWIPPTFSLPAARLHRPAEQRPVPAPAPARTARRNQVRA